MRTRIRRAGVAQAILAVALCSSPLPLRAQFDEPDSIPRFSIGATIEAVFRGKRGDTPTLNQDISFGGGPPVGLRVEYRVTRTLAVGAAGSWGRLNEKQEGGGSRTVSSEGFSQWQGTGELHLKVKPSIPGYFILGGGARRIIPDSDDPADHFHSVDPFTDVVGILGAGIGLGSRASRVFKLDLRLYLVSPGEQLRFETKSVATDFSIGFSAMLRL